MSPVHEVGTVNGKSTDFDSRTQRIKVLSCFWRDEPVQIRNVSVALVIFFVALKADTVSFVVSQALRTIGACVSRVYSLWTAIVFSLTAKTEFFVCPIAMIRYSVVLSGVMNDTFAFPSFPVRIDGL